MALISVVPNTSVFKDGLMKTVAAYTHDQPLPCEILTIHT